MMGLTREPVCSQPHIVVLLMGAFRRDGEGARQPHGTGRICMATNTIPPAHRLCAPTHRDEGVHRV